MRIAIRDHAGLACGFVIALGAAVAPLAVLAEEVPQEQDAEVLPLEEGAVDSATLDEQSGTTPDTPVSGAGLAVMPDGATSAPQLDQPSFASSQSSIATGAVSSSSLQATTAGGAVSLGQ